MNISTKNNNLIISNISNFNLAQTLECGQCFHFTNTNEDEYDVLAMNRALHVAQVAEESLFFYGTSEAEFQNIWVSYFDLSNDYDAIKKQVIDADLRLISAVENRAGMRLLNQDFFETLISFIISQNNHIPRIRKIIFALSEAYGEEVRGFDGEICYLFPSPEALNAVTEDELRALKVGFRAPYILDACRKYVSGDVTEEILGNLSYEDAKKKLTSIKGVGEKVANCVLLFGLGRREAFPVDVWIKRIMEEMYFEGKDTKKEVIEAFAKEKFGEYGGYAQQYLFELARSKGE